ncbi:hypothetical protein [Cellulomonas citrea]|uniref:hypothetical protein n=1 Tax=Cellulomonas citrea TaxID=1909423 RepID=UPI001356E841|nr:hypothetical protein [Cellulomonas citrea]
MRALPYRTPAFESVLASPWVVDGVPLGERLDQGWDYQTQLAARRRLTIDVARVRREAGLTMADEMVVSSRYRATGSLIRHRGNMESLAAGSPAIADVETEVRIDGADLAGALELETTVTLGSVTPRQQTFVARRPGSILWRRSDLFAVEGGGGLLPVARTSFAGSALPKGAWFISAGTGEWDAPAMGHLLVLLNEDNPGVLAALERTLAGEFTSAVWQALALDIVHTVLSLAADDPDFATTDGETDDEISKAALATRFIRTWYAHPGEEAADALGRLRYDAQNEPARLRAVLQERLHFLGRDLG